MMKDLEAVEKRFNEAAAELRRYRDNSAEWAGARESLDRTGRRHLVISETYFDELHRLEERAERARVAMIQTRKAWVEGR